MGQSSLIVLALHKRHNVDYARRATGEVRVQTYFSQNRLGRSMASRSAALFLAAGLAVLAGCGSGSGLTPATGTGGGSGGGGTGTTPSAPTLTLALTNAAGATVTSISMGAPATVKATLKNAAGAAVANSVVTFSTDVALATITPTATALTDSAGVASVTLNPATIAATGAATITASAQVDKAAVTGSAGFAVGVAAVTVSAPVLGVGAAPLSAFGTTSISVVVTLGGVPVSTPQNVTFSSSCASVGKATLSTGVATVNGTATGSYRDNGCAGTDSITASAAGVSSASTSLVVTPPTTGSIQFVSATPSIISLKGIGGTEASQVRFKVLDAAGNPLSGKTVTLDLSTTVGGITLTPAAPATAISDANGLVVITVNSGTVSTPVRVIASTPGATAGTTLTTQSSGLTITTGIPDQDSFSLSATKLNAELKDFDGGTTVLTARLADHFNNPVPDGTVVNFTASGGSIVGSCSTTGGVCSSTLTGQAPRPANGRVTVLAYAVGEESFIDLNGNGVADLLPNNEMFDINGNSTDMPEAFRDDNENGIRDANETFIDFNQNGLYDGPDGKYSGVLCDSAKSSSGTCAATKSIHVRRNIVIIFSGSTAVISKSAIAACNASVTQKVDLRIVDAIGNPTPAGSAIDISMTLGSIAGANPDTGILTLTQANTNVTPPAGPNYSIFVSDFSGSGQSACNGVLTLRVTTPGGTVTTAQFPVSP